MTSHLSGSRGEEDSSGVFAVEGHGGRTLVMVSLNRVLRVSELSGGPQLPLGAALFSLRQRDQLLARTIMHWFAGAQV